MTVHNVLFIMADQLRADYLSCYGHPHLETPAIDWLANTGVKYSRAYAQAPVCGPSRMSFYTGRYVSSHGSTYNGVPLRVGEPTLGDHLRPLGVRVALVGKTHMTADLGGFRRLGIDVKSCEGVLASQCGFEPFERDDGLWPGAGPYADVAYNRYLKTVGYDEPNPWERVANSTGTGGDVRSGWLMRNAAEPARLSEEHSETAYMTRRAMDFMKQAGDARWFLHLSYIKPHWPYIAPAPYHAMYKRHAIPEANRSEDERRNPHPVYQAYMNHEESLNFSREEVRQTVIPAYMGLIRQIDDRLNELFSWMGNQGLLDNTMIVFTSDHGDYLGDHWLGEKELFHEESVRIPLILRHPGAQADATRGVADDRLVESIDLAPTFVEAMGGAPPSHVLEGRSLIDPIFGRAVGSWRDAVISECDYAFREARRSLNVAPDRAKAFMVRTEDWKFIHFEGFSPQLFDLRNDPRELRDLGSDPVYEDVRRKMRAILCDWALHRRMRITISDEEVARRTGTHKERGLRYGVW